MLNRCALFILLLSALAASTAACGWIGGSAPEGPAGLIPDSAREVVLVDVSQAALNRTDLPANLESQVSSLENYGDVRRQAMISLASGTVTITGGDFDLQDIKEDLRSPAMQAPSTGASNSGSRQTGSRPPRSWRTTAT